MRWLLLIVAFCGAMAASTARAGVPTSNPFDAQASQIVASIVAGDFAAVLAQADPTVSAQLSVAQLANAWRTYQELLGSFQSAGQPMAVMRGELTVEQVPVQLANSAGEIRIAFHPDGTIAGLFFLRPGVPVP